MHLFDFVIFRIIIRCLSSVPESLFQMTLISFHRTRSSEFLSVCFECVTIKLLKYLYFYFFRSLSIQRHYTFRVCGGRTSRIHFYKVGITTILRGNFQNFKFYHMQSSFVVICFIYTFEISANYYFIVTFAFVISLTMLST